MTDDTIYIPVLSKLISIHNNTIYIQTHRLGFAFNQHYDDFLSDFFAASYQGQPIVVVASDGENVVRRGVVSFFEELCQQGLVDRECVTFMTYDLDWDLNFKHKKLGWWAGFYLAKRFVSLDKMSNVDGDAKFVGCLTSRFTPSRLKLAYQIDKTFPNDNFLTFRNVNAVNGTGVHWTGENFYSIIDTSIDEIYQVYQDQLRWLANKKFDVDSLLVDNGFTEEFLPWADACRAYHSLWPKYQIECVSETDVFSSSFLTEKTSKCLLTAKPFVLMSGPGSLKNLQKIGFTTYGSVIDESYDLEPTPHGRMTAMIHSLKNLYHSPDRQTKINQLNEIAKHNQSIYDNICKKIQLSTRSPGKR